MSSVDQSQDIGCWRHPEEDEGSTDASPTVIDAAGHRNDGAGTRSDKETAAGSNAEGTEFTCRGTQIGLAMVALYSWKTIDNGKIKNWLEETWWFVRRIFPLLLAGVFIVGIIGAALPEEWIKAWLGGEGLQQSFLATLIGSITYFATMTEAPFVDTLMNLGMGKGPALALLLTGPGISLPNWLAIARVFGVKKAAVYVLTIIVLGTLVGWVAGFIFG
ncbi:hypothetical protein ES708_18754 [subsurface metagenome]